MRFGATSVTFLYAEHCYKVLWVFLSEHKIYLYLFLSVDFVIEHWEKINVTDMTVYVDLTVSRLDIL